MKYRVNKKARTLVRLMSVLHWSDYRYPQPVKGTYDVAVNKKEKMKWAYRSWIHQLERAEKGSGIEDFFAKQKLDFTLPEGFTVTDSVSLAAGGDLMAVDCLTWENTPHLFDDIKEFYLDADLTAANLESTVYSAAPIGRNQKPGMPAKMNTSVEMLQRFWDGGNGINYFSTANNHCYDYGEEGLFATMEQLDALGGCWYSGTNRTPQQQEDVLIIEKNGVKIAMLAYVFDMNGNHYDKKHLINEVRFNDETVDLSLVTKHVQRAREKGADLIIANCHWGWEFEMYPHRNIIDVGHRLIEMGIDVILGGHPHVAQPMECYEYTADGEKKKGLIVYSLGDFVSFHPLSKNSKLCYVVRFDIAKGEVDGVPSTQIHNLQMLPVYVQCAELDDGSYDCRLLNFHHVLQQTDQYLLDQWEKQDLNRLNEKVLHGILLPKEYRQILSEG